MPIIKQLDEFEMAIWCISITSNPKLLFRFLDTCWEGNFITVLFWLTNLLDSNMDKVDLVNRYLHLNNWTYQIRLLDTSHHYLVKT